MSIFYVKTLSLLFDPAKRMLFMEKTPNTITILNPIWTFFKSVKLTVLILLMLASTSIIGTLIPQNGNPATYIKSYGDIAYRFFHVFDIFDMYHSWWFQLLIVLLAINIIICSMSRLSGIWKIVFTGKKDLKSSNTGKRGGEEFTDHRSYDLLQKVYEQFIEKKFNAKSVEQTDNGFRVIAEKGRWTRLGVFVVHLSIVILLLGSLIGSIFGFDGSVNIMEGETVDQIWLRGTNKPLPLDFKIRCDDFNVSYYESGAPKEFRSNLTILEEGEPVRKKSIIVNDPLRYRGINMFQSSYGNVPPKKLEINLTNKKTNKSYKEWTSIGEQISIGDSGKNLMIKKYSGEYTFKGSQVGEAFICEMKEDGKEPVEVLLPIRFPSFDRMRKGDWTISVSEHEHMYYTGLQVTRDPGIWLVYTGFIMMIIGCFISFFMAHQKICVEVTETADGSKVKVSGSANKNRLGMQEKVKKISMKLKHLS